MENSADIFRAFVLVFISNVHVGYCADNSTTTNSTTTTLKPAEEDDDESSEGSTLQQIVSIIPILNSVLVLIILLVILLIFLWFKRKGWLEERKAVTRRDYIQDGDRRSASHYMQNFPPHFLSPSPSAVSAMNAQRDMNNLACGSEISTVTNASIIVPQPKDSLSPRLSVGAANTNPAENRLEKVAE